MTLPQIDYTAWRFWMDVLQMVATVLIGVYVWWTSRERVTTKRFQNQEDRITVLEVTAKNAPVCKHHDQLSGRIEDIRGDLRELTGSVNGVRRAVDLMNEFLINNGAKK